MSHKYFINVSNTFHCMCGFSSLKLCMHLKSSLQYATIWNIHQEEFWFSTFTCFCIECKHSMHSCDQNWKLWMHLWILYLWEWECWAYYSLVYCFWSNIWLQLDKRVSYHINKLKMDNDFPNEIPNESQNSLINTCGTFWLVEHFPQFRHAPQFRLPVKPWYKRDVWCHNVYITLFYQ